MTYDMLILKDIEPYLDGRSYEDLKVGDEIAFPEPLNPESLVGLEITVSEAYQPRRGTIESFDSSTGKHVVVFYNHNYDDDKISYTFKGDKGDNTFVFEGSEAYFDSRGVCTIRELRASYKKKCRRVQLYAHFHFSRTCSPVSHFPPVGFPSYFLPQATSDE
jgi:hypothetical protein